MWTLAQAVELIGELQPLIRDTNYHVTLGGGVLNHGKSEKDLDLFIVPLNGYEPAAGLVMDVLLLAFGSYGEALRDSPDYHADANFHYRKAVKFTYMGKRIDVFVA